MIRQCARSQIADGQVWNHGAEGSGTVRPGSLQALPCLLDSHGVVGAPQQRDHEQAQLANNVSIEPA